ncbi:DUF72 domain-containing protein [Rossellomorea marisflavi]|uniref:DUF72 domain-containing protein n=1 Tax=Rossellomorea marisflavi TaxID=189381 RepID=UPI0027AAB3E1|nr:DUF72 domain-containing protein [Rossellomorea marisflavi]UTE73894.1 DUF72 domain-containing protein [Rossellomorea marisflavi]
MIYVGVTGWGDHDTLYENVPARDKLKEYGAHFPVVEVDASFYAVQPVKNVRKWVDETPDAFHFIVKAYQGMTGHQRGEIPFESKDAMFEAFKESIVPFLESGKLAMVLFQFPPWFDCTKDNVNYIRYCREQMQGIPVSLEFRHQSWYSPEFRQGTLSFMKNEDWIHSICDEPQAGEGSVPRVVEATNGDATLIRFHGRNVYGWNHTGKENWREVRYLYRYNQAELEEWIPHIRKLEQESEDLYILFNNNSGGDAADNAKQMIDLLGIQYSGLAPKQLDLF